MSPNPSHPPPLSPRLTASGRRTALTVLLAFDRNPGPVDALLRRELDRVPLDPRELGLAQELIRGVLQRLPWLDAVIGHCSSRAPAKLAPPVLWSLRLAVLQLLFLDRIPDHAVLNESVNELKKIGLPRPVTGFVNGVLRGVQRYRDDPDPKLVLHPYQQCGLPLWLYKRWHRRYGKKAMAAICRDCNTPPPMACTALHGPAQLLAQFAEAGIAARRGRYGRRTVLLTERCGSPQGLPGFAAGQYIIQDQGAQLVTELLPAAAEGRYLDACAGLGGKTIAWAVRLPQNARLTALEPDRRRFQLLRENLRRTGYGARVQCRRGELQDVNNARYDAILLDVPCSGLGVIRRHPEIRWLRSAEELQRYQQRQLALLQCAARLLKPGGILVYATCSTEPEENDQVVERFIANDHGRYSVVDGRPFLPAAARDTLAGQGMIRTRPGSELDGFFAVRLVKNR